mgnify:CR=1 FL=1
MTIRLVQLTFFSCLIILSACNDQPLKHSTAVSNPASSHRIISVTLATDEILLSLVEPKRIAALSALADDPHYSNVVEQAKAVQNRVQANAEQVLALNPDLVFYAAYNQPAFVATIQKAGVRAREVRSVQTLRDIGESIRQIGKDIGEEPKAEALARNFESRIEAVRQAGKNVGAKSVLYYDNRWIAGKNTIIDDMITAAGATNYAAAQGIEGNKEISAEVLSTWNPDVVLIVGDELRGLDFATMQKKHAELAGMEAVRAGRAYEVPARVFGSLSQYAAGAPEMLESVIQH